MGRAVRSEARRANESTPCLMDRAASGGDDGADESSCVCCLDAPATMVMSTCGHLVFCGSCRKRVVCLARRVLNAKELPRRALTKTGVKCPICRRCSFIVIKDNYDK